jgi:hypothetical protein
MAGHTDRDQTAAAHSVHRSRSSVHAALTPRWRTRPSLRALLRDCQPHQVHKETIWGPDVGCEVLD